MKKLNLENLNLNELKLKRSELSRIKGGTTTTVIVGAADTPCTITENEWYDKVDDKKKPDVVWEIPCGQF